MWILCGGNPARRSYPSIGKFRCPMTAGGSKPPVTLAHEIDKFFQIVRAPNEE